MQKLLAYAIMLLASLCGGASLIMFGLFCYAGSLHFIKTGLTQGQKLLIDFFLSLAFFLQHSGMVRKSFRRHVAGFIPEVYFSAIYAIVSGIVLFSVVILWQETSTTILTVKGIPRLLLRIAFFASIAGFIWGIKSLEHSDAFGVKAISDYLHSRKAREVTLTIRGPYRWVRHPLYLCVLVMICTYPYLTWDRLLFNVLWSIWIYIGAAFEERDLLEDFGDTYQHYQKTVPMIFPLHISPSWPEETRGRMGNS